MIYAFFLVGTFWFWVLVAAAIVALFFAVENESGWAAFWIVAGFILLVHLLGDASFFAHIRNNPWDLVTWGLTYLVLGFLWSIGKYSFKMNDVRFKLKELKDEIINTKGADYDQEQWKSSMRNRLSSEEYQMATDFKQSTKRVLFWATYWPWSFIWSLFDDIIYKTFKYIYENWIIVVYKAIHRRAFGDLTTWDGGNTNESA